MAYGCWIPLFRRQQEYHILVGVSDPLFGERSHSHVQLGVCCTCLVVLFIVRRGDKEWSEIQPLRLRIPPTDLVCAQFLFIIHIVC
jgi:hypothetical protein